MPPKAYDDWISIYNVKIGEKWESERVELRKVSMIYFALQNELQKLKQEVSTEIEELKSDLKQRDYLQKSKNFVGFATSQWSEENMETNKENEIPEIMPLKEINQNETKTEDFLIESPNTASFFDNCPSPPLGVVNTISSAINKSCLNSNKKKTSSNSSFVVYPAINHKVDKTPKLFEKKSEEFKTPKNADDSNIMECSIIEDTPNTKPVKKSKISKLSLLQSGNRKKTKCSQSKTTTLTQMFNEPLKKKKKKREIDSSEPSMSINAMLELINQSSDSETDEDLDKIADNLNNSPPKSNKEIPVSFIDNYDKVPEKKNNDLGYVYDEVVRGKERKNLKGWTCQECADYYEALNLPLEKLEEKKNQCSRHRHKFQAREETYAGFWDLTFGPTPKS